MRILSPLLVLALAVPIGPATASSPVPSTFVISGAGLGHGVGMSQVGAFVQAQAGRSAAEIISHYFPNAQLGQVNDNQLILVNVAQNQANLLLSAVPIRKAQSSSLTLISEDQQVEFAAGSQIQISAKAGLLQVMDLATMSEISLSSTAQLNWSGVKGFTSSEPKSELLITRTDKSSSKYRFGPLLLSAAGNRIQAVLQLTVRDEYLNAVAEMASTWPAAALQAQAIASRSIAMNALNGGIKANCACHVNHLVDQNMRGSERYSLPGYPNWRKAVKQTFGQVVTTNNQPVAAWFFARSTGKTENSEDVWGSPRPWAISVDDQFSIDPAAGPQVRWQVSVSSDQLAKLFKLPDVVKVSVAARNAGGSVRTFRATSSTGEVANLPGRTLRAAIPTRSVWIQNIKPGN